MAIASSPSSPSAAGELLSLRAENAALKAALQNKAPQAPKEWPQVGEEVVIESDWDGPALYHSDVFLSLKAGDHVLVTHVGRDGLRYGTVQDVSAEVPAEVGGWLGGKGIKASYQIALPLAFGPSRPPAKLPNGPPWGESDEATWGENDEAEGEVAAAEDADLDSDVQAYLERHGIDDKASQALLELTPDLQREVIKSDMTNCRNPSAVLRTRIDRVRSGAPAHPGAPASAEAPRTRSRSPRRGNSSSASSPTGDTQQVEQFIQDNGLDDRLAGELLALPWEIQEEVISEPLKNARNPSAVVKTRIERVRSKQSERAAQESLRQEVEDYLQRHGVDEKGADALLNAPQDVQQEIIKSDMSNCRNPSAVLASRVRSACARVGGERAAPAPPAPGGRLGPGAPPPPALHGPRGRLGPGAPPPPSYSAPRAVPYVPGGGGRLGPGAPPPGRAPPPPSSYLAAMPAAGKGKGKANGSLLEDFCKRNDLDEAAVRALREMPQDLLQLVVDRGDLVNCRNPSKVLQSRIRQIMDSARG